jgi:probable rRNA maturation factor
VSGPSRVVEIAVDGLPMPPWRASLSRFCCRAAVAAGFGGWEISVLLCGDERMKGLNARYRGKKAPTDVLSFAREEESRDAVLAGDLAICLPAMRRNAERFAVTEDEELKRLLIHGILHLAGMDHGRGKGRAMLSRQEELLEKLRDVSITG